MIQQMAETVIVKTSRKLRRIEVLFNCQNNHLLDFTLKMELWQMWMQCNCSSWCHNLLEHREYAVKLHRNQRFSIKISSQYTVLSRVTTSKDQSGLEQRCQMCIIQNVNMSDDNLILFPFILFTVVTYFVHVCVQLYYICMPFCPAGRSIMSHT